MPSTNGKWTNPSLAHIDHEAGQALQSLSSYLGSWTDDHLRNPILTSAGVNETRGNATVVSQYRITAGQCHWYGHYIIGSTTAWNGGVGNISLLYPPGATPDSYTFIHPSASMPGSAVRAYNGGYHPGSVEFLSTGVLLLDNAVANTVWGVAATQPFAWAAGSILSWNLSYPI